MDHRHNKTPSSLSRSVNNDAKPPVVFRRMPSNNTQFSSRRESSQDSLTNVRNDIVVPGTLALLVHGEDHEYNAPATPHSTYGKPDSVISLVDEALLRATSLADVPVVATWMSTRIVEEGYDGEMVMKVEIYLSRLCLREYRKQRSETRFLQATSLVGHLFKLGAITSLHILSIAETLVITIDQPMRIQGIMVLFASAGPTLCRAESVARTTEVAAKLKEASFARPRNELLRRYSREIESFVDVWTKVEEYKALWE